eukprot:5292266-Pleurochrysis_carterae.AAC.1
MVSRAATRLLPFGGGGCACTETRVRLCARTPACAQPRARVRAFGGALARGSTRERARACRGRACTLRT